MESSEITRSKTTELSEWSNPDSVFAGWAPHWYLYVTYKHTQVLHEKWGNLRSANEYIDTPFKGFPSIQGLLQGNNKEKVPSQMLAMCFVCFYNVKEA